MADLLRMESLIPPFERQYQPLKTRRYRADFAWPMHRLLVEVEGGTFLRGGGGHNRAMGYHEDLEKYNLLAVNGWTVLRFDTLHVREQVVGTVVREWFRRWTTVR